MDIKDEVKPEPEEKEEEEEVEKEEEEDDVEQPEHFPSADEEKEVEEKEVNGEEEAEEKQAEQQQQSAGGSGIGWNLMKSMGYVAGSGLGKRKQGMLEPIPVKTKIGRLALGGDTEALKKMDGKFDVKAEQKGIAEEPTWLSCSPETHAKLEQQICSQWIVNGKPKMSIDDEDRYCSRELIADLLEAKSVFDTVDRKDLDAARARANPYETIKAGFFQNRAAMKTANLDKIFDWRLSREFGNDPNCARLAQNPLQEGQRPVNRNRSNPLFYFADVCAGPGGFSEYMLWRKAFYNSKGFGFTLAGRDDFKLDRFKAACPEYFETFYGVKEDGNVMDPENLESLEKFVRQRIHAINPQEKGVHLVMCDGGFSVEGQENIQEILSKRLYLCQFIAGLSLLRVSEGQRRGGNFLCKLFDVFTPFSMGLLYLMYAAFERISIHKPITSRPANSERYIFCENLKPLGAGRIREHMVEVNNRLHGMDSSKRARLEENSTSSALTVLQLVPEELIQGDAKFMDYMRQSNEEIARRQVFYLRKYRLYAMDPSSWDGDQAKLREEALRYWELPDFIERAPEQRGRGGRDQRQQQLQQREPVATTLQKYAGNQLFFPIKKRLPRFTSNELAMCPDLNELRALLLPETEEPVLFVSQGHERLFMHKRNGMNFEVVGDLHCTVPKDTVLLVQITTLYESKGAGKIEPAGRCLWVLDAAVLNGDDVSQLELKDRLVAARKFCEAMNRVHIRRAIFDHQTQGKRKWATVSGHSNHRFSELLVADPMRLGALPQRQFEIKQIRGTQMAFFPVHAGDDPREKPPQQHFLCCRGVRVINKMNPNYMLQLQTGQTENGQSVELECAIPRRKELFSHLLNQNPYSTFYEALLGSVPSEQWISTFPSGHPHNGAIAFHWSWQPDYTEGYEVANILNDPEHKAGLTMQKLRRIVADRKAKAIAAAQQQLHKNNEGNGNTSETEVTTTTTASD